MPITHRPMRPKDVGASVQLVAAHPVLGPRFGEAIGNLEAVWLGLLGQDAFRAVVFEDSDASHREIVGVGVSCFVSDDFLDSIKKPPFRWVAAELTEHISRGESPLLSNAQIREANMTGGLNLVTWVGALHANFLNSVEAHIAVLSAFFSEHQGFLLKEITGHGMSRDLLDAALRSGAMLLGQDGQYVDSVDRSLDEVFSTPHHFGLTRELALSRVGTWASSLFAYEPPRCSFRRSEQRLLLAALRGGTDLELACELGITLSAVKKTWLSIYDQVSIHLPMLFPDRLPTHEGTERGKEKKQRLLTYLREHPEELRPAAP